MLLPSPTNRVVTNPEKQSGTPQGLWLTVTLPVVPLYLLVTTAHVTRVSTGDTSTGKRKWQQSPRTPAKSLYIVFSHISNN